jgi:glycosyltransferase involved in cell wall biosynthesis
MQSKNGRFLRTRTMRDERGMPDQLSALKILAIEPYYGGSHQAFLDGYRVNSRHHVGVLGLPARKWKWRMRGGALTLSERVLQLREKVDAVFVSDFCDLTCLIGLCPRLLADVPKIAYFHEDQLTYPLPDEGQRDYQFGFTNVTTALASDRVLFNSRYHMESFIEAVRKLFRKMPDCVPHQVAQRIEERSRVVPVGLDLETIDAEREEAPAKTGPPVILWNHRWEYDKDPETFFNVMTALDREGYDFRMVVLGQSFRTYPEVFERACRDLRHRISHFGFVESRVDYVRTLLSCDIVISTAIHEFFGMAVCEAVYAGCFPLLPNALTYPELLPEELHQSCLYADADDLLTRLRYWLRHGDELRSRDVHGWVRRFGWDHVAPELDAVFDEFAGA